MDHEAGAERDERQHEHHERRAAALLPRAQLLAPRLRGLLPPDVFLVRLHAALHVALVRDQVGRHGACEERGNPRDYTPFLLILQGMSLQSQGISLPPF